MELNLHIWIRLLNIWWFYKGVRRLEIINETTNVSVYIDIISRNLFVSASQMELKNFIFQQDNDPKHTSKLADEFFDAREVTMFEDWSPQSPDLNPIENLWFEVKKELTERQPKNINELKLLIVEEWSKISVETCRKYSMSFKKEHLLSIEQKMIIINAKF